MKTRCLASFVVALLALASLSGVAFAQITPKTANLVQTIGPDGSVSLTMEVAFDAFAWKQWKAQVGDEPSRLRAMMKHQFTAYVIDDFKFEKDDLNRTAKMTVRSPAGPDLRKDGRFSVAVEKEFRLVNNNGREWFFSGNNPYANNSLQTVKLTLPANAYEVALIDAGSPEQSLVYSLKVPSGKAHILVILGVVLAVGGALLLAAGFLVKRGPAQPLSPSAPA